MKDNQSIHLTIDAFRDLLEDIFQISTSEEEVKKIFSKKYKHEIEKRVDYYFDHEVNDLYSEKDLYTMKDGVKYLLEKVRNSRKIMKALFYATLFNDDEILLENEMADIMDKLL
ncbi:MAG: hypothetical protein BAJALOKI3v1_40064 [Promethearchaeota archaeon]|nr:MAG: hypothetical protein BAJALOKI3v1_40064 [Candidatus Lokiarchaeota archaeon]